MLIAYLAQGALTAQEITSTNQEMLQKALWIDVISPTRAEEELVEHMLKFDIPTRDEMREIELSSRLYKQDGNFFMTGSLVAQSTSPNPQLDAVTFILTPQQLITIRYIEPQAFKLFISQLTKSSAEYNNPIAILLGLLDANVDRLADILEYVGRNLDFYGKQVFQPEQTIAATSATSVNYQTLLQQIGINNDLTTKARESLVSFNRMIAYFNQNLNDKISPDGQAQLTILLRDLMALSEHANFISNKINFLLDATLGLVSIEQNKIIKIFSVAAVIFLPPTLIASIYGMNFHVFPGLEWRWGSAFAMIMMLLSAWLPYQYFKHRKWL